MVMHFIALFWLNFKTLNDGSYFRNFSGKIEFIETYQGQRIFFKCNDVQKIHESDSLIAGGNN